MELLQYFMYMQLPFTMTGWNDVDKNVWIWCLLDRASLW